MRIAVAEDVLLMRQGIISVLAAGGHDVVCEVGDATEILPRCIEESPRVLVTDVRMPPGNTDDGLRAALAVREQLPDIGILVLSQYVGNEYARRLLASTSDLTGGTGYLLKESVGRISRFLESVERVARGEIDIDPRVVSHLLEQDHSPIARLTPRQREVLSLLARGRTNAQIAEALYVSPATLERTISQIFAALDLSEIEGNRRVLAVLEYLRV
ncbi:response regulator transcription factor [Actinomycetaceae bacterium L2_0104]